MLEEVSTGLAFGYTQSRCWPASVCFTHRLGVWWLPLARRRHSHCRGLAVGWGCHRVSAAQGGPSSESGREAVEGLHVKGMGGVGKQGPCAGMVSLKDEF